LRRRELKRNETHIIGGARSWCIGALGAARFSRYPFLELRFPATGAPTARTLPDRLGELKNVKDFGARGNGSTNDTAAIQAAVNRGGHIFFPGGIYNISSPILVSGSEANVRLTGESCILEWVGPNAGLLGCNADDDGENDRGLTATDTKT
jgi:polygalacturonase